jgi:glucokinase
MGSDDLLLGFDIGGTRIRTALAHGQQIVARQESTWPAHLSPVEEARFVAELALDLMARAAGSAPVRAAGVALAATTDTRGSVILWPNRPSWQGLAFRSLLEQWLQVPIAIEDDVNASALAEWAYGVGQIGYQHMLLMMVGTGVGAGLILNGQLFKGHHGWAGELGHVVMSQDGPACACGHQGCLQVLASGRALERVALAHGLNSASAVTNAAEQGEPWASAALADCGSWLGLAAANVVNLLDLEAVVIGGSLSMIGPPFWSTLEETLYTNILSPDRRSVALHRAQLSDNSGLMGAIILAERLL